MVLSADVIAALQHGQVKGSIPLGSDLAELSLPATTINGTKASSGNNELVAAPGTGYRLVVTGFVIQNESTTALIMRLRSASTSNGWRALGQNQGDGLAMNFAPGDHWKLNENEALNLELSDADTCAYAVRHYTKAV